MQNNIIVFSRRPLLTRLQSRVVLRYVTCVAFVSLEFTQGVILYQDPRREKTLSSFAVHDAVLKGFHTTSAKIAGEHCAPFPRCSLESLQPVVTAVYKVLHLHVVHFQSAFPNLQSIYSPILARMTRGKTTG